MLEHHVYKVAERQVDVKLTTPLIAQYILSYKVTGEGRMFLSSYNGCCFNVGFLCIQK